MYEMLSFRFCTRFHACDIYKASPRKDNGTELSLGMYGESCRGHFIDVVLHLSVCL